VFRSIVAAELAWRNPRLDIIPTIIWLLLITHSCTM
jgi:hypothetical protein